MQLPPHKHLCVRTYPKHDHHQMPLPHISVLATLALKILIFEKKDRLSIKFSPGQETIDYRGLEGTHFEVPSVEIKRRAAERSCGAYLWWKLRISVGLENFFWALIIWLYTHRSKRWSEFYRGGFIKVCLGRNGSYWMPSYPRWSEKMVASFLPLLAVGEVQTLGLV